MGFPSYFISFLASNKKISEKIKEKVNGDETEENGWMGSHVILVLLRR